MKKKIFKYYHFLLGSLVLLASCTKKVDEAFMNPNATTRVPIETLLPGVIGNFIGSSAAAGSAYGIAQDGMYVGRYIQNWETYTTGTQYDMMGGATGASDVLGSVWAMHYFGQGQNVSKMIEWGTEEKKWDYVGVAYAVRAYGWITLTDMYGEAILKQAFDPNRLVFQYDTQEEIYAEVRRMCHLSLSYLNMTGDNVSQANLARGDAYFYNGDVNKWKKFVYTVLARSFNHFSNKTTYNADSVIYYCNQGITTIADMAAVKFANSGITGTSNFYGPLRNNVSSMRQARYVTDLMTGNLTMFTGVTDPRTPYLLRENTNGTYKGIRPNKGTDGLATADQPQNFWGGTFGSITAPASDANSRYIFKNGSPFPVITPAETFFMKAEAYYRKGDKTNALAAYVSGIGLSFDLLTSTADYHNSVPTAKQITAQAKSDYLANTAVVPAAASGLTLSHIMLQKYIALYGFGCIEVWMDMRRFHYTDTDPATGNQVYAGFTPPSGVDLYTNNNGKLVYRARPRYNSEYLYNVEALKLIGGLDLDYHTKEMWITKP